MVRLFAKNTPSASLRFARPPNLRGQFPKKSLCRTHVSITFVEQVPLREPDLLIILTGGKMAYTRPDGVKIIPLACLKD